MADEQIYLRSFRVVFDLERRIHRIDRFRVPLPYGLPVRSIAYGLVGLLAVLMLARLPLAGEVLGVLPAPARYVLVPVAMSYAMTQLRVDGRSAHQASIAWARFVMAPRSLVAFRPLPPLGEVRLGSLTCVIGQELPRRRRARFLNVRGSRGEQPRADRMPAGAVADQLELW